MSSLLNASTSIEARPGLVILGADTAEGSRRGFAIVSKVFEKGFNGACEGGLTPSSSDVSDVVPSKGSSSLVTGVGGFMS